MGCVGILILSFLIALADVVVSDYLVEKPPLEAIGLLVGGTLWLFMVFAGPFIAGVLTLWVAIWVAAYLSVRRDEVRARRRRSPTP